MSTAAQTGENTSAEVAGKAAYHHGDLRAQLLNAVRQLVETKGAENFSIAEAARVAGVSSAAPYRHFKDKPEILKALVLQCMAEMSATMRSVMEPYPAGSIDRINALGHCYINFARDHPGLFRLVFGISESHDGDAELATKGSQVFGIVIETVADYFGVSPDHPQAKFRAYMLWSVVHGHSWLIIDGKAKMQGIEVDEAQFLQQIAAGLIETVDGIE
ncbi:MAG: TetR/AcrR family transcriptional regulator [Pseudomonadota bacterium]